MEENARTTKFSGRLFVLVWISCIATLSLGSSCPDPNVDEYKPCDVLLPVNKTEGIDCNYTKGLPLDVPVLGDGDYKFPQCPRNLYAGIAAVDDGQNSCQLRLNITWQAPFDASLDVLWGFLLNISFMYNNSPRSIIRTFRLTVSQNKLFDVYFRHLCVVPAANTTYDIEIFGLPTNKQGQPNSARFRLRTSPDQPSPSCQTLGYPNRTDNWKFVMWQRQYQEEATIEMCFLTPPTSYGFTKYEISLLPYNSTPNNIYIAQQKLTVDPSNTASVCVNFTNACQQVYSVWLQAQNEPRCTCRNGPKNPENCVDVCYATIFEPIDMSNSMCVSTTNILPSTSSKSTPHRYDPLVEQSSTQRPFDETGKIVGIVVGVTAAMLFIVVAFVVWRCTRRRWILEKPHPPFPNNEAPTFPVEHEQSVLLVYSSDNEKHRDVVRQFAAFLHGCCKCDVRFDEWSHVDISQTSALDWLTRQICQVRHVIIINSKGSFMQHQAWLDLKTYRPAAELMLPDMFVPAFRQIESTYFMNWEDPKRKLHYHHISFPYTENKHLLNVKFGRQYKLIKHIEELFLNIHGMTKYSSSGKTFAQEINAKNYTDLPEGRQLSLAIEEACHFHLENPSWFERYFRCEEKADPITDDAPCEDVSLEGSLPRNTSRTNAMMNDDVHFMDLDCIPPSTTSSYIGDIDRRSLSLDIGIGDSIYQGSSDVQLSPIAVGFCPPTEDDTSVYSYNFMEKIQEWNEQYDSGLPESNYDVRSDRSSSV